MEVLKFVGMFIQYAVLPCAVLLAGVYFILFANTKITKGAFLKVFGNFVAAAVFLTALVVLTSGIYSLGVYNKMAKVSISGINKSQSRGIGNEMMKSMKMLPQQQSAAQALKTNTIIENK